MKARTRISPEQKIKLTAWAVEHREEWAGKTRREVAELCESVHGFAPSDSVIVQVAAALAIELKVQKPSRIGYAQPRTAGAVVAQLSGDVDDLRAAVAIVSGEVRLLVDDDGGRIPDLEQDFRSVWQAIDDLTKRCNDQETATRTHCEAVNRLAKRVDGLEPVAAGNGSWRPDHAVDGNGQGGTP